MVKKMNSKFYIILQLENKMHTNRFIIIVMVNITA